MTADLPGDVVDEAERLTRLARAASDPNERRAYERERATLIAEYGFVARVRETDDTLVLYPDEWVVDGTVRTDRIEDTDGAVERSLSGPGAPDEWERVERDNAALVERVRERAHEDADTHAANARALADFAGNHYAKRVERLTEAEVAEFLDDYFPRNAWPDERQRALVEESVALAFEVADVDPP